ncbi:chitin elicitor receptor kinase 1 [Artemisia annua]|uniref:Chitin elicitor receptor kinase 1 n=1 Tax=Artemisia annua TaxID=35608 RepID=A0A2U1LWG6_ARTAN|nr:chitin elicitor receptor kinase 1 [Artemisia annua]
MKEVDDSARVTYTAVRVYSKKARTWEQMTWEARIVNIGAACESAKTVIADNTKAAIKKMDMQASKEFSAELKVRLLGYCVEEPLFWVYEFSENGNLSQHLRGSAGYSGSTIPPILQKNLKVDLLKVLHRSPVTSPLTSSDSFCFWCIAISSWSFKAKELGFGKNDEGDTHLRKAAIKKMDMQASKEFSAELKSSHDFAGTVARILC